MTEVITKSTVTKYYGNWEGWCKFLTHTGIKKKLLDGIPKGDKTILVLSFTAPVQRNQFGEKNKSKLLYGTVKAAVSDVSMSFRAHLQGNLNLETPGKNPLSYSRKYWDKNQWTPSRKTRRTSQTS